VEVEFELNPDDLAAFQAFHAKAGPAAAQGRFRSWVTILIILGAAGLAYFYGMLREVLFGAAGVVAGVFLAFLLVFRARFTPRKQQAKRLAEDGGWRRLSITPEGVIQQTPIGHGTTYWNGIVHIGSTRRHVFLYNTPQTAFVVPLRAFRDDREFDDFVELARRLHDEYKDGPPAPRLPDAGGEWERRGPPDDAGMSEDVFRP
jgi:hypothetical protein